MSVDRVLANWAESPCMFVDQVLGGSPRYDKQIEIMKSVRDNRETLVKSCHGVGKSFCAADVVLWFLLTHCPSKVITTAPSWAQVEKLLWSEINTKAGRIKIPYNGLTCLKTELRIKDDWFAIGISPKLETGDEGSRMAGFHSPNLLVVFDEAPAVDERLWKIKEALMTSANVRFLGIGNPVEDTGPFFEGFRDPAIKKITMGLFDSPNFTANGVKDITDLERINAMQAVEREAYLSGLSMPYPALTGPRWACDRLRAWGRDSAIFKSRVLGEFPGKSIDTIISLGALEKAKHVTRPMKTAKVLGVDVARFGSDSTCIFGYESGRQIFKEKYNGADLVHTAGRIRELVRRDGYKIAVIDDTGLGGGVTDMLSDGTLGAEVVPVNFGEGASNDGVYDGRITELFFTARDMIVDGDIEMVDEDNLFQQLSGRKYRYTPKGKIRIESKDEYKKRTGLGSPDEADAFILCVYGMTFGVRGVDDMDSQDGSITGRMYK